MIGEIHSENDLNKAIENLQQEKDWQRKALAIDLQVKITSLQPANLVRSVANSVMAKPFPGKGLLITAGAVGTALLLRKAFRRRTTAGKVLFWILSSAGTMALKKLIDDKRKIHRYTSS